MIEFPGSCLFIINDVLIWIVTLFDDILRFNFFPGRQRKVKEDFWDLGGMCVSVGKPSTVQA